MGRLALRAHQAVTRAFCSLPSVDLHVNCRREPLMIRPAAKKREALPMKSHIRCAAALLGLAIAPALAVEDGKFADFGA
jgi:hypothetical protein